MNGPTASRAESVLSKTVGTLLNGIRRSVPMRSQEAAMMRYRTLLLGLLGLSLVGCAGYDYDDNYDRSYGRSGSYTTVYGAPYVQRYEVYSAPRYYRAPAPRYYVPAPAPRYYSAPRRGPVYNGWNQPPRGYYPAPHRYNGDRDRHHARDRDGHRGDGHRGNDRRGEHRSDNRNGGDWRQRNR